MARSVADVALLLSAIAGPGPPIADRARRSRRDVFGAARSRFQGRAHRVVDGISAGCRSIPASEPSSTLSAASSNRSAASSKRPSRDFAGFDEVFKTLRAMAFLTGVADRVRGRHRDQVKDTILWEIERGERLTPAEIAQAGGKRTELYHRMRQFMERYEFFVLPVVQVPPFDVNQPYVTEIDGVAMETYIDWMKSCYYISVVGNPAISVPARLHARRAAGRPADRRAPPG